MFAHDSRYLGRGVAGKIICGENQVEIKEKAQLAIQKIEAQLNELNQLRQKGHVDEVSDRIDRWYERTKKTIDE